MTKSTPLIPVAAAAVIAVTMAMTGATPAHAQAQQPAAQAAGTAQAAFKRADANGDGKLSKEEAARLPAVAPGSTNSTRTRMGS